MAPTHSAHADHASASDSPGPALGFAFRFYKAVISPMLHAVSPGRCLYLPTCSEYAYIAVSRFGVAHGGWLALRRFARCHPWAKGGLDPVPLCIAAPGTRAKQSESSNPGQKGPDHLP